MTSTTVTSGLIVGGLDWEIIDGLKATDASTYNHVTRRVRSANGYFSNLTPTTEYFNELTRTSKLDAYVNYSRTFSRSTVFRPWLVTLFARQNQCSAASAEGEVRPDAHADGAARPYVEHEQPES